MKQKKYIVVIAAFAVMLPLVLFGTRPKGAAAAKVPVAQPVNIQLAVDSAMIMADNYCLTMADNPEMAGPRLNILKAYYGAKPQVAQDSIRERLFDLYVSYVEQERAPCAEAMKGVYLALASDTDEHLGAIYANELNIAREVFDTTAVNTYLPLLDAYATRMNYDYDDELTAARRFLHTMRTRRPIRDAIPGVWVSEEVLTNFEEEYPLINTLKVLQIRETNHPIYRQGTHKDGYGTYFSLDSANMRNERGLDIIKSYKNLNSSTWGANFPWYVPIEAWELPAHNMDALPSAYVEQTDIKGVLKHSPYNVGYVEYYSRLVNYDNDSYSIYAYWGDERLKRANPEIAAIIRQATQQTRAAVAGRLARSSFSFGKSLAGNLAAGMIGTGVNALVDAMMVSTDKIWGVEITLHMNNTDCLTAHMFGQMVLSKSNSSIPVIHEYQHSTRYYRWEPQDSIFFMGTVDSRYEPWKNKGGLIYLHKKTKEENRADKERVKAYCGEWKKWYEKQLVEAKAKIKSLPKGSAERKQAEEQLKEFKNNPPQVWQSWNKEALDKLKAKAARHEETY